MMTLTLGRIRGKKGEGLTSFAFSLILLYQSEAKKSALTNESDNDNTRCKKKRCEIYIDIVKKI